jgi:hypothetical protein
MVVRMLEAAEGSTEPMITVDRLAILAVGHAGWPFVGTASLPDEVDVAVEPLDVQAMRLEIQTLEAEAASMAKRRRHRPARPKA